MRIKLYQRVALTRELPEHNLSAQGARYCKVRKVQYKVLDHWREWSVGVKI